MVTLSADVTWLHVDQVKYDGDGFHTAYLTVTANPNGYPRNGTVTVTIAGVSGKIRFTQTSKRCDYSLQLINVASTSFPGDATTNVSFLTSPTDPACFAPGTQPSPAFDDWIHVTDWNYLSGQGHLQILPNKTRATLRGFLNFGPSQIAMEQVPEGCRYTLTTDVSVFDTNGGAGSYSLTRTAACDVIPGGPFTDSRAWRRRSDATRR